MFISITLFSNEILKVLSKKNYEENQYQLNIAQTKEIWFSHLAKFYTIGYTATQFAIIKSVKVKCI